MTGHFDVFNVFVFPHAHFIVNPALWLKQVNIDIAFFIAGKAPSTSMPLWIEAQTVFFLLYTLWAFNYALTHTILLNCPK
jgi:hypothetical protein